METSQPVTEIPAKNNRTLLIIVASAIALCCFCIVVAVVGYIGFVTIRTEGTAVPPIEQFATLSPEIFGTPESNFGLDEPPQGGLGNDILRQDTWQVVASAATGQGCDQPIGQDSTIEVLQEPDANGVWLEKWTVVCRSGDSYTFEVEYILDATGVTFNIRSLP